MDIIVKWICQNLYMDFFTLLHTWNVKVFTPSKSVGVSTTNLNGPQGNKPAEGQQGYWIWTKEQADTKGRTHVMDYQTFTRQEFPGGRTDGTLL